MPAEIASVERPSARVPGHVRAAGAILVAFASLNAVGTMLLVTPLAAQDGHATGLVDALFTAVSAATDTGLVVVDTADHWSFFGEFVIAALIFLGGVGIMASATVAVLLGRRTTLERRSQVSDAFGGSLASGREIVRGTLAFAIVAQVVGATLMATLFVVGGDASASGGFAWVGIFQAISSFNNAGFDVIGGGRGYTVFAERPDVLLATAGLVILGGLGFVITLDLARHRRWAKLALETKLVVVATVALTALGALGILAFEWDNPGTLGALSPIDRIWNSFFMSVSPRSAGFNSVSMPALQPETDIITLLLMFVGSASGSTGGGIKVNTLAVLVLVALAVASRRDEPEAFGRRLAPETVFRAITVFFILGLITVMGSLLVTTLSSVSAGASLFEAVSALGSVGLSIAGTATYDEAARLVLAGCMFVGRLGPLAIIILLFGRGAGPKPIRRSAEPIRVG